MAAFIPNELYGIIGFPLGQTMSPLLHNTGFQTLGIPAVMLPWSLESKDLEGFVKTMRILNIRGCSVTIPHKTGIIPFLDKQSERVKMIGACNTLYWEEDKLCGENTDVLGFLAALEAEKLAENTRALILGGGGAARAVVVGLKMRGVKNITIVDIVDELPDALAKEFDLRRAAWDDRTKIEADIIVNSTPLGMLGKHLEKTAYSLEAFKEHKPGIAYDVVYTPAQTRFAREAAQAGWKTIRGQAMFFAQGNHQFKIWTGKDLPQAAVKAVESLLEEKARQHNAV